MSFVVRTSRKSAGDQVGEVYELIDADESTRIEVWPQSGFNCLEWQVRQPDRRWGDILYKAPDWEANPVPTRSGHPILFPFPGRLRDGTFTFEGRRFSLPKNDSTKQHAIHGFTPRNPWRVIDWKANDSFATITGQFSLSKDLPGALPFWPADFNLTVTYRISRDRLRVEAVVENLGPGSLPFGLGYHPYFRLPVTGNRDIGGHMLQAKVNQVWDAVENLPTGSRRQVEGAIDFRARKSVDAIALDYVFTAVEAGPALSDEMRELAELAQPNGHQRLQLVADAAFRELVLFTPPHRRAIAIEPYTCSADAANLAARGIDSGWRVLAPPNRWEAAVEYRWLAKEAERL